MYVINIFSVSAPLRGFSGALKGSSESVPKNCYFLSLSNREVLMSCLELLLLTSYLNACNRNHHEILPPVAELVHASIKFALFTFFGDFTNKTEYKTTISVHEFLSNSTFDYSIILLFDFHFFNNFIFLFYRYYYFNVYFFNICLHINRM